MIISTPEELSAFLPSHVLNNLDTMVGFLDNSEHDFLRERIGDPLLEELNTRYAEYSDDDKLALHTLGSELDVWGELIVLCQRCVAFDAFARSADIQRVSVNDAGLNISESKGYDSAPDKTKDDYKSQLIIEAHAASNRLLLKLEEWQKSIGQEEDHQVNPDIKQIVQLWQKSAYYYYVDGLFFNTATEFGLFVNIYKSREKFIQLLPDIRYCQEVYIESELGEELMQDLLSKRRDGTLSAIESKAVVKIQRTLSLQVEARSSMFSRREAKDEAAGHMKLTLDYIRKNQTHFDVDAIKLSPLYDHSMWETDKEEGCPKHDKEHCHGHKRGMFDYIPEHHKHSCDDEPGMLISSLI